MQEAWEFVRDQIFQQSKGMNKRTEVFLKPAFEQAYNAVESICPLAMGVGKDGFQAAYGPAGIGIHDILVISANARKHVSFTASELPKVKAPWTGSPGEIWGPASKFIDETDTHGILCAILARHSLRKDDGVLAIPKAFGLIRSGGLTPALILVVRTKGNIGAGLCGVVALPPSIELQLAEPAGSA